MRTSVVLPAMNEAGNIGRLVEETYAVVPEDLLLEVIVVDDGSTDPETLAYLDELRSAGTVVLRQENLTAPDKQGEARNTTQYGYFSHL